MPTPMTAAVKMRHPTRNIVAVSGRPFPFFLLFSINCKDGDGDSVNDSEEVTVGVTKN